MGVRAAGAGSPMEGPYGGLVCVCRQPAMVRACARFGGALDVRNSRPRQETRRWGHSATRVELCARTHEAARARRNRAREDHR